MVKLTTNYLFHKISKKNRLEPKKEDEADLDLLKGITRLNLQSQFIDKISYIPNCQSVSVVYLQNNLLRTTQNLKNFPNLTHLYLQHNFISKLENLDQLTFLRKLYLGYNEISIVEGLEKLVNLTELHLENQRLPQGETLYFDPLTLFQLRNSLKVLNVSNNNMSSVICLSNLVSLNELNIENNKINSLDEVMETLSRLPLLETLKSEGNPVVSERKYFDAVVFSSKSLKNLNGKQISEKTRIFITNLEHNKALRKKVSSFSTQVFKSNQSFPTANKPRQTLNELVSKSSAHLGSKLFPVLKSIANNSQKNFQRSSVPSQELPSIYRNSLNISHLSGSSSYYY